MPDWVIAKGSNDGLAAIDMAEVAYFAFDTASEQPKLRFVFKNPQMPDWNWYGKLATAGVKALQKWAERGKGKGER